ncbi:MAG: hypothetical protein IJW73_05575 [Candidatus Gastranaerophilales bacterium]|nr:hypothetical protein [Candidatus Gastranaerophilales bacterium]
MQVNFSSTPFKSSYRVDYNLGAGPNSIRNGYGVECFCKSNAIEYTQEFNNVRPNVRRDTDAIATGTIVAGDWDDEKVEGFLSSRGIQFVKTPYADIVGEDTIIERCVAPEYTPDSKLALLDVETFEKFLNKHPNGNADYCEEIYHKHFAKQTEAMVKSGNEITVPALHINSAYLGVENMALQFGEDAVPDGTLSFYFNQTTNEPNHCLYYAMKNCGMTRIPVSVDERSFELGKSLGLFE